MTTKIEFDYAMIVPTEHEKREWSRLAQAAFAADKNDIGYQFSCASAFLRIGESCALSYFDELQAIYRKWLISGFEGI